MTTTILHPEIRPTRATHQARSVQTFVEAFHSDPTARWLFPEEATYSSAFTAFAKAFAGPAFQQKSAFHTTGFAGASAWFTPGVHGDDDAVIDVLEKFVPADRLSEAFGILEQMDAYHPTQPHWYLPLLGVRPDSQGQGLGSRLLGHVLRQCDETGHAAYLESSNAANLTLYQRHGFKLMGEIQSGSSPILYPMLRNPQ